MNSNTGNTTASDSAGNGDNAENNRIPTNTNSSRKSKDHLKELGYLLEEERLLADLKRKTEETLQRLKVEEITLIRYVRGLTNTSGDPNQPIMLGSIESNSLSNTNAQINTQSTVSPVSVTSNAPPVVSISHIEQNVNTTEVLKLDVNNLLMPIEAEEEDEENDDQMR